MSKKGLMASIGRIVELYLTWKVKNFTFQQRPKELAEFDESMTKIVVYYEINDVDSS
jgi:hypothetical protein